MTDTTTLRKLAEAARDHLIARKDGNASRMNDWNDFCEKVTPTAIIALLDELDSLQKVIAQQVPNAGLNKFKQYMKSWL